MAVNSRIGIRVNSNFRGNEAVIHKEGDRLMVEPLNKKSLLKLLSTWQPSEEGLLDVDEGLLPHDDVEL